MAAITSQVATEDYLSLLTIQLQNQDPINPVNQEDFIAQLSQFSMLEGLEELNTSFAEVAKIQELNQGVSLVGKEAEFLNADGEQESGLVEQMFADQGPVELLINGQRVALELISGVRAGVRA